MTGCGLRVCPAVAAPIAPHGAANLLVYKHTWMVIVSGFFEPLFYLLGIGIGLGSMVPPIDGMSYSAFVAPGLLASSCLNGAITDGFFNIFFKLHYQKTYDGILATPMRVPDVAFGEMLWALARVALCGGVSGGAAGARRIHRPSDAAVVDGRCSRGRPPCWWPHRFRPWRSA